MVKRRSTKNVGISCTKMPRDVVIMGGKIKIGQVRTVATSVWRLNKDGNINAE